MKLLLAILISAITLPSFAGYPLNCRGGAMEAIGFQMFPNNTNRLNVGFKAGTKPSTQGLAPGECSWPDRGFRAGEPTNLCIFNVKEIALATSSTGVTSCTPKPQLNLFIHWADSAPWLKTIRDNANYFTVNVTSNGKDCMVVTP